MEGWIFRKFNRIDDPQIEPHEVEIINKNGGMPSSNSTVQEIKTPKSLESFERDFLKPIFGKTLDDLGITFSSVINTNNFSKVENPREIEMPSLNQILFGPPGTGKTYNTINKSIEIANPSFDLKKSRSIIKTEFDNLIKG